METLKKRGRRAPILSGRAFSFIILGALAVPASAFAQDLTLDTIVVTAQKRTQNVQDVPIAITAVTPEIMQNRGIASVAQLSDLAPNVTLDAGTPFSGSTSVLAAYIRGIGQNDFAFNLDPGVGVYIDGVYLARSVGANTDLLDVQRIEILKGPQGTLFGRNTIGGAISIVTRDPADEFGVRGEVTTGSFNRFDVRGSVDMPITDTLKSNLAFSEKHRQGFQHRIPYDPGSSSLWTTDPFTQFPAAGYKTAEDEGGIGEWNLRGKVRWDMSDDIVFTGAGDYSNVDQTAQQTSLLAVIENNPDNFQALYNTCISLPTAVLDTIPPLNPTNGICGPRGFDGSAYNLPTPAYHLGALAGANADANPANDRLPYDSRFVLDNPDLSYANGNSFSKLVSWGLSGTFDITLNDSTSLKSISAYRQLHWRVGMDLDGSPLNFLHTSFDMPQKEWSQELQLTGTAMDSRLKYVVGGYFFHEEGHLHDFVTFAEGLLQIDGPNDLWTTSYAAFTHLNYQLTDSLSITVGARYTDETKKFEGFQHDLNGINYKGANLAPTAANAAILTFPVASDPLRYFPAGVNRKHFTDFSPRIGLEYHVTDNTMLYGSYSEGFKSGSWTTRLSNPLSEAPDFNQEQAKSWEGGVKSQFLDRRVQLNLAGFYTNYDGIQLNFQEGVSPTIRNAGDARIWGGEAELEAVVNEAFTVNAAISYMNAEYTRVEAQAAVPTSDLQEGVYVGASLPKAPKWKFNLSPRYEVQLANDSSLVFNVDYTHTTGFRNDTEGTYLLMRPNTDVVNASVTYKAPDDRWELAVGGTNIFDERFITTGQAQLGGGVIFGTWDRPAEWYATLRFKY